MESIDNVGRRGEENTVVLDVEGGEENGFSLELQIELRRVLGRKLQVLHLRLAAESSLVFALESERSGSPKSLEGWAVAFSGFLPALAAGLQKKVGGEG